MVHSSFLTEALDSAKNIATGSEHNIIDMSTLALGILQADSPFSNIFPQEDKERIIAQLEKKDAQLENYPLEGDAIPLTMNTGQLLQFGSQYAQETGDGELDVYHIMLALFSYPNEIGTIFKKSGWVFENFLAEINKFIAPPIEIERMEFDITPSVKEPYSKLRKKFWADDYKKTVADNHVKEAIRLADVGRYDICRQVCEVVLDLDKDDNTAKHLTLWCLYHEKQYQDAIEYSKGLDLDDRNINLCIAACYVKLNKPEKAIEIYRSFDGKDADLHNGTGACLNDLGKYEDAIKEFDQAIELDPAHAFAINNKGYALLKTGHVQEAKDLILHALSNDKGNARAYKNLALVHIEERHKTEALAAIEQALFYRYREDFSDDIDEVIKQANAL